MTKNRRETSWHDFGRRGFTLLELMVVLLILALLASIAAPQVTKHLRKARADTARLQIGALGTAVDAFYLDVGRFPTQEEGLLALVERTGDIPGWDGPYIRRRDSLIDPWGQRYQYRLTEPDGPYEIVLFGTDPDDGDHDDHTPTGQR